MSVRQSGRSRFPQWGWRSLCDCRQKEIESTWARLSSRAALSPSDRFGCRKDVSKLQFFVRPTVVISRRMLLVCGMSAGGLTISALAAEPTLFPLWNTLSPNGQYAIGWSTPGSTKKLPQPYETDSALENWLINVRTRERIVKLPNSLYWSLPSGTRPNHDDLVAAWASDSSAAV
jgi:hypothetical protein